MMRRHILLTAALLPMGALGGCIHLLPPPPPTPRIYVLEAGEVQHEAGAPVDAVITVSMPDGQHAELGSDVIWRTGDTLAYVAQTQWSSRAEDALQSVLSRTMTQQGRFKAAVQSGGARSDYEVRWDVTNFEVVETAGSIVARFAADVRIVDFAGRRVIAARSFATEAPVADRSSTAATQALARAAREACAQIGVFAADSAGQALAEAQAAQAALDAQTQTAAPSAPPPVRNPLRGLTRGRRR